MSSRRDAVVIDSGPARAVAAPRPAEAASISKCMAIWLMLILGGPVKTEHVESRLIAQYASVRPGTVVTVGLHLKLDPEWHVYWSNPGDSGDTVHLKWTLPEGVKVGPIQWPGPHRIMMPGEIMNFGYEGDLLLPVAISVPSGFSSKSLGLKVKAEWLVCDENMCVPGFVDLELTLPVSADAPKPDARWAAHFEKVSARLPGTAPRGAITAYESGGKLMLRADLGLAAGAKLEFFPYQARQIEHAAPQPVTRDGGATLLELTTESDLTHLRGVLVIDHGRTFRVDVAVTEGRTSLPVVWISLGVLVLVVAVLVLRRKGS